MALLAFFVVVFLSIVGAVAYYYSSKTPMPLKFPLEPTGPLADPAPKKKAEILYKIAVENIGIDVSPLDIAPDALGCVESLNSIFEKAFKSPIQKGLLSTKALLDVLQKDSRFQEIYIPELGCIALAATGTAPNKKSHGHCGVWGNNDVLSNDSDTGLWADNYTHVAFIRLFGYTLGFTLHYFRVLDK